MDRKGGQYVFGRRFMEEWLCNFRGTTFATRRVARNLQWGGLFCRLEAPSNDLDPDFDRSLLRLSRLFCPNLGDLKKKKKGLHSDWVGIFFSKFRWSSKKKRSSTRPKPSVSDLNYIKSLTDSHRQCQWGAILVFGAKIGLKSNKNGVFCILFRAMGWEGCRPPPPWLRYCLQLH